MTDLTADWLPGIAQHVAPDAGPMRTDCAWKLVLHTTEGGTFDSNIATLVGNNDAPHLLYDPNTDQTVQFIAFSHAGRALKGGGSAGTTNAARAIQVEIVGFAHQAPGWSPAVNRNLGRMIAFLSKYVPFQVAMPRPFYGDASGFTVASAGAPQRMSWADWYGFGAICGHEHVPANDHWDPGAINAPEILAAAGAALGTQPPPVPHINWVAPPFPGNLGLGQVDARANGPIATLKVLLSAANYGAFLDMSAAGIGHFDKATKDTVAAIQQLHNQHEHDQWPITGAVGQNTWTWLCELVLLRQTGALVNQH